MAKRTSSSGVTWPQDEQAKGIALRRRHGPAGDLSYRLRWCKPFAHGMCAAVELPVGEQAPDTPLPESLTKRERQVAAAMPRLRRVSWVGGRLALRFAAQHFGWTLDSVEATARGAPLLPQGLVGSIAHKTELAIAMVDASEQGSLGVDLEQFHPPRPRIEKLVMRRDEREQLQQLQHCDRWPNLIVRFSIKEAIFKAIDPTVLRYVGFKEAHVEPLDNGMANVILHLVGGEGPFDIEARWGIVDDHVFASVRARSR